MIIFRFISFLPYILQLLFIIDVIRKGKAFFWIWLLVFVPFIGGIAYLLLEFIPEVRSGVTARPKKINEKTLELLLKHQDTIANRIELADFYMENERYEDALGVYDSCLSGPYKNDKDILFKKCQTLFYLNRCEEARPLIALVKEQVSSMNEDQKIFELMINDDFDSLEKVFFDNANFKCGYYCVRKFVIDGNAERAQKIIDEMKENISYYKNIKKSSSMQYYRMAKALM